MISSQRYYRIGLHRVTPDHNGTKSNWVRHLIWFRWIFWTAKIVATKHVFSDVTIRLYRFRSISIRFFDQQFDLDSIRFRLLTICTPLLTQVDSRVAAWERPCCGTGHPRSYPPTAAVVVGLNKEDAEWAKYRSNSVALWHGAEAAELDRTTAHTNSIHCLMFSLAPCGQCPLSDVQTSPTLVNRPTCLHACNTRGCR